MISTIKVTIATVLPESLDVDYLHHELATRQGLVEGMKWRNLVIITVHRD